MRVPVNVAASATNGNNTANLSGGGDPACTAATGQACDPTVNVPVTPTITAVKTVSVNPLVVGGTGQFYNITITVANGPTIAPLLINDALPTGITLSGAPTVTGGTSTGVTLASCPSTGSNTTGCQINTGATSGTIIVRVPVNVAASATNGNNTANLSGGGDPACTAATGQACDPTVPVPVTTPAVSVAKTASPAAGTTVAVGQTITYTLTSTVTNAATTTLSTLTDTLGTGLTFGAIGANPGGYTCTTVGSVVTCTLPIGTPIGSYSVSYTATVNASATTSVSNSVVPTGGPTCTVPANCTVSHPFTPTITISNPQSVAEGTDINNTITLSGASALPVTVTLATSGNGANPATIGGASSDTGTQTYSTNGGTTFIPVPVTGIITIPAGVTSVIVRTPTVNDTTGEPAETFGVTLSAPSGAVLGAPATQSVTNTIQASDPVTVSIANGTTVPEGTNSVFTVSLSNASSVDTSVTFNTSNGSAVAPGDYTAQTAVTVTIPAGSLTATVNVVTIDDAIAGEGNETINGTISAVTGGNGATIATPSAIGTISDNEGVPTLSHQQPTNSCRR